MKWRRREPRAEAPAARPEPGDLAALMGPLSGRHRHDLTVMRQAAGPLSAEARAALGRVIGVFTTSFPPALRRRGLTPDEVLSPLMAAIVVDQREASERSALAARLIYALDLPAAMASELVRYALEPQTPRTLLHHLLYTALGRGAVTGVVEAVALGLASGQVQANAKGAQVYSVDAALWFMAHPRTLALALPSLDEPGLADAYGRLRGAGLVSAVMPLIAHLEEGRASFQGFWSRAEVWRDYAAAIGQALQLPDLSWEGEAHLDVAADRFG